MQNVKLLLDKIREWDTTFEGKKTRDIFLKSEHGKYFNRKNDIDQNGGWTKLYPLATGKKPPKLGNYAGNLEEMFSEYSRLQQITGILNRPLNRIDINKSHPKFSGTMFKNKFKGGLRSFHIEHMKWLDGLRELVSPNIFVGKAAEYLAVAELLFRGYTAQLISVDEGLDVIAYKNLRFYLFQIKHGQYNKILKLEQIKITKSAFENNLHANVYYMFILSNNTKRDFLIVPAFVLEKLIKKTTRKIPCIIFHKNKDVYINDISSGNKVTRYLNNSGWKIL
jgi:hypothetical protein